MCNVSKRSRKAKDLTPEGGFAALQETVRMCLQSLHMDRAYLNMTQPGTEINLVGLAAA